MTETLADHGFHPRDARVHRRGVGVLVGDPHVNTVVLRFGHDRRRDRAHELTEGLFCKRLADPEHLERTRSEHGAGSERGLDVVLPHVGHLAWHAGHRDDPFPVLLDAPSGGGAVRVGERARRLDEPCLLAVALRHHDPACREPGAELSLESQIHRRCFVHRRGDRLAGEVVLRWPKAPGGDDEIVPRQR